jgi:hypothetical protein
VHVKYVLHYYYYYYTNEKITENSVRKPQV